MLRRIFITWLLMSFVTTSLIGPQPAYAIMPTPLNLPQPGTMVTLSPVYEPAILKGLTIHQDNPLLFDFIVDSGQDRISGEVLKEEGSKLIKYFLAALAISSKDLWVNLSPYEKDRMIPDALGQTEMGRDLLAQDYILKQLTASLIYPERALGREFWKRVYEKAQELYGTTEIPVNTFNKVWIMADQAEVFERNNTVFVTKSHLKVMLEEDYLATKRNGLALKPSNEVASSIIREIIIPEIEKEINTGKNFANLRQMFNSIILAGWYKNNLKNALLNQIYADKQNVKGINLKDPSVKEAIYEQYLAAYKKGVFNLIKEEINGAGAMMPRKYFSGGMTPGAAMNPKVTQDQAALAQAIPPHDRLVSFQTGMSDKAMTSDEGDETGQGYIAGTSEGPVSWSEAVLLMKQVLQQSKYADALGLVSVNQQKQVLLSVGNSSYKQNHNGLFSRLGREGHKGDYVYLMKNFDEGVEFDLAPPAGMMGHLSEAYYEFHGMDEEQFDTLPDHFSAMRDELILVCRLIQDAYGQLSEEEQKIYKNEKGTLRINVISKRIFSTQEQQLFDQKENLTIGDIAALKLSTESDNAMTVEIFMNKVLDVLKGQADAQEKFYAFLIDELKEWHDHVLPTEPKARISKEDVLDYLHKVEEGMDQADRDEFNVFLVGDAVRFLERELLKGLITGDQLPRAVQQELNIMIKRVQSNGTVDTVVHSRWTYVALAFTLAMVVGGAIQWKVAENNLRELTAEMHRVSDERALMDSMDWEKLRKVWSKPKNREAFLMSLASDYIDLYFKTNNIRDPERKQAILDAIKERVPRWSDNRKPNPLTIQSFFDMIRKFLQPQESDTPRPGPMRVRANPRMIAKAAPLESNDSAMTANDLELLKLSLDELKPMLKSARAIMSASSYGPKDGWMRVGPYIVTPPLEGAINKKTAAFGYLMAERTGIFFVKRKDGFIFEWAAATQGRIQSTQQKALEWLSQFDELDPPKEEHQRIAFDLNAALIKIEDLFKNNTARADLPIYSELAEELGNGKSTITFHYAEILDELERRILEGVYDADAGVKLRLEQALQKRREERSHLSKERKEPQKFNLSLTIAHIIHLFQDEPYRERMPTRESLSQDLGPAPMTFSNHYPEILDQMEADLVANVYGKNGDLRKRLRAAIANERQAMLPPEGGRSPLHTFDLDLTVRTIVDLFSKSVDLVEMPTQKDLSERLGPDQTTISRYYPDVLTRIETAINSGDIQNGSIGLADRLKSAIEKKRKDVQAIKGRVRHTVDTKTSVKWIIDLFKREPERQTLPSRAQLSRELGASPMFFSVHFSEITTALRAALTDPQYEVGRAKDRLQTALDAAMSADPREEISIQPALIQLLEKDPDTLEKLKQIGYEWKPYAFSSSWKLKVSFADRMLFYKERFAKTRPFKSFFEQRAEVRKRLIALITDVYNRYETVIKFSRQDGWQIVPINVRKLASNLHPTLEQRLREFLLKHSLTFYALPIDPEYADNERLSLELRELYALIGEPNNDPTTPDAAMTVEDHADDDFDAVLEAMNQESAKEKIELLRDFYKQFRKKMGEVETVLYGASGGALNSVLLATGGHQFYMVDSNFTEGQLKDLEKLWNDVHDYRNGNYKGDISRMSERIRVIENMMAEHMPKGWGYGAVSEEGFVNSTIAELLFLELGQQDVRFGKEQGKPYLEFNKPMDNEEKANRRFYFIKGDLEKPESFMDQLPEEGVDVYFQNAAYELPKVFDQYMPAILKKVNRYLIVDPDTSHSGMFSLAPVLKSSGGIYKEIRVNHRVLSQLGVLSPYGVGKEFYKVIQKPGTDAAMTSEWKYHMTLLENQENMLADRLTHLTAIEHIIWENRENKALKDEVLKRLKSLLDKESEFILRKAIFGVLLSYFFDDEAVQQMILAQLTSSEVQKIKEVLSPLSERRHQEAYHRFKDEINTLLETSEDVEIILQALTVLDLVFDMLPEPIQQEIETILEKPALRDHVFKMLNQPPHSFKKQEMLMRLGFIKVQLPAWKEDFELRLPKFSASQLGQYRAHLAQGGGDTPENLLGGIFEQRKKLVFLNTDPDSENFSRMIEIIKTVIMEQGVRCIAIPAKSPEDTFLGVDKLIKELDSIQRELGKENLDILYYGDDAGLHADLLIERKANTIVQYYRGHNSPRMIIIGHGMGDISKVDVEPAEAELGIELSLVRRLDLLTGEHVVGSVLFKEIDWVEFTDPSLAELLSTGSWIPKEGLGIMIKGAPFEKRPLDYGSKTTYGESFDGLIVFPKEDDQGGGGFTDLLPTGPSGKSIKRPQLVDAAMTVRQEIFSKGELSENAQHEIRLLFTESMFQKMGWTYQDVDQIPIKKMGEQQSLEPAIEVLRSDNYLQTRTPYYSFVLTAEEETLWIGVGGFAPYQEAFEDPQLDHLSSHRKLFWWMEHKVRPFAKRLGFKQIAVSMITGLKDDALTRLGYQKYQSSRSNSWSKPVDEAMTVKVPLNDFVRSAVAFFDVWMLLKDKGRISFDLPEDVLLPISTDASVASNFQRSIWELVVNALDSQAEGNIAVEGNKQEEGIVISISNTGEIDWKALFSKAYSALTENRLAKLDDGLDNLIVYPSQEMARDNRKALVTREEFRTIFGEEDSMNEENKRRLLWISGLSTKSSEDQTQYGKVGKGLALAYKSIVQEMGGRLEVESGNGRTKFTMILPVDAAMTTDPLARVNDLIAKYGQDHVFRTVVFTKMMTKEELRPVSELGKQGMRQGIPSKLSAVPHVKVRLPSKPAILSSEYHNGSFSLVRLGALEDGTPVALKKYEVDPDIRDTKLLQNIRGAWIAQQAGYGYIYGVYRDAQGELNMVMSISPGDFANKMRKFITESTFDEAIEFRTKIQQAGGMLGDDFQFFIDQEGHFNPIDYEEIRLGPAGYPGAEIGYSTAIRWLLNNTNETVKPAVLAKLERNPDLNMVNIEPDKALTTPGGIDLNTDTMQLNVRKEGKGVQMNLDPADLERFKREGLGNLAPVIYKITPVESVWTLVGLPNK